MKMTDEKAVEILELNIKEAGPKMPPDVKAALIRAVMALKEKIMSGSS
ncbi:unnamed protein product [marine sediment metagenome]|uniref:Uncharacterized protein n=1 Tax=marine sediment metagenome TaxID=412755 RepID=X1F0L8_9ZZZZ